MRFERFLLRRQGLPGLDAFRLRFTQAQHLALGDVGQLAHIARPVVAEQAPQLRAAQRLDVAAQALGGALGEVVEQQRDIFAALTQRRQAQLCDVQTVRQVFAKPPGAGLFEQVGLGGGNDAQVHMDTLVGAQPLQFLLLQHPQQFDLLGQRHAFDFIQEQRAAVGIFQLADALALGAGERAAFVAEQLGFKQLLGDGRAVERDKRLFCPWAKIMQATGDQFLAAAGFATDQHIDRQAGQVQHLPAQGLQTARHAEQARFQLRPMVGLLMQATVLQDQPAFIQGAAQAVEQCVRAEGFFQKVVGTVAHGFHGHRYIAMAGEQDHR